MGLLLAGAVQVDGRRVAIDASRAAGLLPGFKVKSFGSALVVGALFGLLNYLLGQLFFVVLGVATLGIGFLLAFLTRWIVDAILLKFVAALTAKLEVRGFKYALLGALVMAVVGTVGQFLLRLGGCAH